MMTTNSKNKQNLHVLFIDHSAFFGVSNLGIMVWYMYWMCCRL